MIQRIGLLPASGSASRVNGIPKFAFPYNDSKCLLQYHIDNMLEIVDEIRICTRESWLPILDELKVSKKATISVMEPSTMNDAILHMIQDTESDPDARFIVGMPDTVWTIKDSNPYANLGILNNDSDVTLLTSPFREMLRGKVGQVNVERNGRVQAIIDKDQNCNFPRIWSAFSMNGYMLNPKHTSPSHSFQDLISQNKIIDSVHFEGEYHDLGSMNGLRMFYSSLGREK